MLMNFGSPPRTGLFSQVHTALTFIREESFGVEILCVVLREENSAIARRLSGGKQYLGIPKEGTDSNNPRGIYGVSPEVAPGVEFPFNSEPLLHEERLKD